MTLLTVGMMVLGAALGLGIVLALSELLVKVLPALLVVGGVAWAAYFVTTTEAFPTWMMQGSIKALTTTWYGSIALGGLGTLSIGLPIFPLTVVLSVRSEMKDKIAALEANNARLWGELVNLRSQADRMDPTKKPSA